jgi:TM2 domain-containing membrane protein YozV
MTTAPGVPPQPSSPPPGWYPGPDGAPKQRWWDGHAWADNGQETLTAVSSTLVTYCRACGKSLDPRAVICPRCGVGTGGMTPYNPSTALSGQQPKSSAVAILLSFIFPGAGHLYMGDDKAIAFMVVSGVNLLLAFTVIWLVIGFPLWIGTAIYTMVDSNKLAGYWNAAHGFPPGSTG